MTAASWYRPGDLPGHFPGFDVAQTRVVGGPFDGGFERWPRALSVVRIPTLLDRGLRPDVPLGESNIAVTVYELHELIHAPAPDAEGPIAIEWVWMSSQAYRAASHGLLR